MFYVNRATIVGNVGSVDMKYTEGGVAVLRFGVATSHGVKKGDTWDNVTTWHNVVAFGKTAERVIEWLVKGCKVYVEGRIENKTYEKDGVQKYSSAVIAYDVIGFEKKEQSESSQNRGQESAPAYAEESPTPRPTESSDDEIDIEDIPF